MLQTLLKPGRRELWPTTPPPAPLRKVALLMRRAKLLLATTMGLALLLAGVGVGALGWSGLIQAQSAAAQTVPDAQSRSGELSGPPDSSQLIQKANQEGSVQVIVD